MSESRLRAQRLREFWQRLTARMNASSRDSIEASDVDRTRAKRGRTPISDVSDRQKVLLFGTLQSVTYHPVGQMPLLEAKLYDGTGSIDLRWPGRSDIPGFHVGRHVEVEGTVGIQSGHFVIVNPLYRIVVSEH